jgi:hypothetical protein
MIETARKISRLAVVVIVGALFAAACSSGASDAEFVAACMNEGEDAASQALDKELGITREAFCKCGAPIARASLSADGYRAMILDMQGKREEAAAISAKMSESEQQVALGLLGSMVEKCGVAAK